MKLFIDLCCGLGGASQAFWDDSSWFVIRIDNNEELLELTQGLTLLDIVETANVMNVMTAIIRGHGYNWEDFDQIVVWSSPPCNEFSTAFNAPKSVAARNDEEYSPDMTLVKASMQLIEFIDPEFWYIENVRGAITDFEPLLGRWRQQVGSFFLWGNHPMVDFEDNSHRSIKKLDKGAADMRAQWRAKVPIEISQAIKDSIDKQLTLDRYFS